MTLADLAALLPLIVLSATAVVVMVVIAFHRNHLLTAGLTGLGLVVALITLPLAASTGARQVTALLIVDGYALFYMGLLFAASFAVAALAYGYLEGQGGTHEEFYILLLLATLGAAVLVASSHFASFFLGLEILSVSLYTLIAYPRWRRQSIEAGIKYLILAAASAAFLLFGMALVYAELGTMEFAGIASLRATGGPASSALLLTGLGMLIVGIGFKLAVVPFHLWTPDVYEGAPAPVTAFVATVSKGGMFALLLRFFTQVDIRAYGSLFLVFALIAVVSMLFGNLLALLQSNVKRILAYSSIAHLGYLLVAFLTSGALAVTAVTFYLVAYFVTTLGAFGVISALSGREREADTMEDYRGLFWRRPWLAAILATTLFSLAGIPLTAGFVGKFYILAAGVGSALWSLVIILVIASAIGLFYYLRIIVVMYLPPPVEEEGLAAPSLPLASSLVLAVLLLFLIWFGVYPTPLIDLIQATARLT
ncbi:MAG: NADH-quinone oxidoreductase subunit N [Ardenticatenaceae bacterium]|nr:NADH-quinone oxidoreductase subunit N [Ardenticatenaceae bacterium]HBY95616.1 NADH-quinone oxidoreductase subunit N [Chloroflexota bacterium]